MLGKLTKEHKILSKQQNPISESTDVHVARIREHSLKQDQSKILAMNAENKWVSEV